METLGHRLVIGPAGSGTTHRITTWKDEHEIGHDVVEVRGDPSVPVASSVIERVRSAADAGQALVIVHDAHWLPDELVIELVHATDHLSVWASRRPWPVSDVIRSLDDRLTLERPADRTGPVSVDDLAPMISRRIGRAAPSDLVEALHTLSAGWVGIALEAAEAVDAGWRPGDALPVDLRDRLMRRVERAGPHAVDLVRVLVVDPDVDPALADRLVLEQRPGSTGVPLRAARAGGLLDTSGGLVPLIGEAVRDDMTAAEVAEVHESLSRALTSVDRDRAVDHAVAGSARGSATVDDLLEAVRRDLVRDPVRAAALLERARSAGAPEVALAVLETELHLGAGRIEALATLERARSAGPAPTSAIRRLGIAVDLRTGRWDRAAAADQLVADQSAVPDARPVDEEVDHLAVADAVRLAAVMTGLGSDRSSAVHGAARSAGPLGAVADALVDVLAGRRVEALRALAEVADDEIAGERRIESGLSPSFVAALAALMLGEPAAAEAFVDRVLDTGTARGEERSIAALRRYLAVRRSRSAEVGRSGADRSRAATTDASAPDMAPGWARDELLEAALTTALARRTGDLVQLRSAWGAADPVLLRVHPAWVLLDPLTELLVTGSRLGHRDRTTPVVEQLRAQVERAAAPDGPVAAAFAWAELHLALVGDPDADLDAAVARLQRCAPASAHSGARADAAAVWHELDAGRVDEAAVVAAVDSLVAVDEGWEAARLAGQAALDAADPAVTRRLLERARAAAVDPSPTEQAATDGLVGLGLSEREVAVARLVADGRTHKEIGGQLYVSPKTVEHHVARIRQKLGAATRAELIAIIRDHG